MQRTQQSPTGRGSLLPKRGMVRCETCSADVDVSEWHPVRAGTDAGGLEIQQFCSEDCRETETAE
jgi:hypothetical protein